LIEETLILLQIIFIDIILAADNAIIIGLIAANFVPKNRKLIIFWGVVGALIFKILFAIFATYLFQFYWIKIIGGLLLIWIVSVCIYEFIFIPFFYNCSYNFGVLTGYTFWNTCKCFYS